MVQLDGAVTAPQLSVVPVLVVPLAANPLGAVGLALHVAPLLQAPSDVQG
jgi:hypothetical protein